MVGLGSAWGQGTLGASVPVVPDAGTARRWAQSELTDPIYHPSLNILGWLKEKLGELLSGLSNASTHLSGLQAVAVVLLVAAVVVAIYVAGPVRRNRTARQSHVVLGAEERTARLLREAADRSAANGDFEAAVADGFRAIIRSLEERAVLDPRPGRTAHEAATACAAWFPALADRSHHAGRLFDDVCYGHTGAGASDYEAVRALDRDLADVRPESVDAVAGLVAP
jgi:hypothetical protein